MLAFNGLDISISRGDSDICSFTFNDDVPSDGTRVVLTVREAVGAEDIMIRKVGYVNDGIVTFDFVPSDTMNYPFGWYWYDISVIYGPLDIFTPFKPSGFKICEVVGDVAAS